MLKKIVFISLALFFIVSFLVSLLVNSAFTATERPPMYHSIKDPDGGEPWGYIDLNSPEPVNMAPRTNLRSYKLGVTNASSDGVIPVNSSPMVNHLDPKVINPAASENESVPSPAWRFYLIWLSQLFFR